MRIRESLLGNLAKSIDGIPVDHVLRVGIDGVDGAGKTTFADELARVLERLGRRAIRASVDGFHNPASLRYRLGRASPQGFFADSYNYEELKAKLLDPLGAGGSKRYRTAIFDHRSDAPVAVPERLAEAGSILVFDGIFLHRPELRKYWDFSIFLEVGFDISIPRGALRGAASADPNSPRNRRYVEGQEIYLRDCKPKDHATVTINNEQLAAPYVVGRHFR